MVQIPDGQVARVLVCMADDCKTELGIAFSEAEHVLTVGEHFRPTVQLRTCGGQKRVKDTLTWHTADSAVVAVIPTGGSLRAWHPVVR